MFPLRAAAELGVDGLLVIGTAPLPLPYWQIVHEGPPFVEASARALEIAPRTMIDDDFTSFEAGEIGTPIDIITPNQLVHDAFFVNQALIRINIEYGYMLAHFHFNAHLLGVWGALVALLAIEAIVQLRKEVLLDECAAARLVYVDGSDSVDLDDEVKSSLTVSGARRLKVIMSSARPQDGLKTQQFVGSEVAFNKGLVDSIRARKVEIKKLAEGLAPLLGGADESGLPLALSQGWSIRQWWENWEMHSYPIGYRYGGGDPLPHTFPPFLSKLATLFSERPLWSRLKVVNENGTVSTETTDPVKPSSTIF